MKKHEPSRKQLEKLLEKHASTAGMYVRALGDHLTLGRMEPHGPDRALEADDRLRLTHLGGSRWGLSVRRHTGRWEQTPFTGTVTELSEVIWGVMQHLVAPYG